MLKSNAPQCVKKHVFRIQTRDDTELFYKNQKSEPSDRRRLLMRLYQVQFVKNQRSKIKNTNSFYKIICLAKFRYIEFSNFKKLYKYLDPAIAKKLKLEQIFFDPVFKPPYSDSRFSDGKIPVFYSALEKETAKAESCHWYRENIDWDKKIHRVLFSCDFFGSVKDLQSSTCPKLKQNRNPGNGYAYCQKLGKQASKNKLGGLLVPSAREPGGVNLPIFSRSALSNPCLENYFNPRRRKTIGPRTKEYFDISCDPKKNRRMPKK